MSTTVVFVVALVGLVLLQLEERRRHARELAGERQRADQLLDRLMAGSLAEYSVFHDAGSPPQPELPGAENGRWVHDPTGLQSAFVPAREDG